MKAVICYRLEALTISQLRLKSLCSSLLQLDIFKTKIVIFLLTLLYLNIHLMGIRRCKEFLVYGSRLVEELHQESTRLLILASPDDRELLELLLHHTKIVQRVLQPFSVMEWNIITSPFNSEILKTI